MGMLNMKKHTIILLLLGVCVVSVAIFFVAKERNNHNNYGLMSELNIERFKDGVDEITLEDLKTYFYPYEDDVNLKMINPLKGLKKDILTSEEAIEDIEYLGKLLKYGYSGYMSMGGDEAFQNAIDKIKKEVLTSDTVDRQKLLKSITDNLKFINDGHLIIDGYYRFLKSSYYLKNDIYFDKDEKGFYRLENEQKKYIETIDNNTPEEYLKKTLDKEGNVRYNVGILSENWSDNIVAQYRDKSTDNMELKAVTTSKTTNPFVYKREDYEDGGCYIGVSTFNLVNSGVEDLEAFSEDGKNLKDKKYIILDLRGNRGGAAYYANGWIYHLTGYDFFKGRYTHSATLETNVTTMGISPEENAENSKEYHYVYQDKKEMEKIINEFDTYSKCWGYNLKLINTFVENDMPIFVLVDKGTVSAGERAVSLLRKINNVAIIGSNTRGIATFGNPKYYYLPNSHIELRLPNTINYHKADEVVEGVGYLPDIWIDPSDSLESVLKYVRKQLK